MSAVSLVEAVVATCSSFLSWTSFWYFSARSKLAVESLRACLSCFRSFVVSKRSHPAMPANIIDREMSVFHMAINLLRGIRDLKCVKK